MKCIKIVIFKYSASITNNFSKFIFHILFQKEIAKILQKIVEAKPLVCNELFSRRKMIIQRAFYPIANEYIRYIYNQEMTFFLYSCFPRDQLVTQYVLSLRSLLDILAISKYFVENNSFSENKKTFISESIHKKNFILYFPSDLYLNTFIFVIGQYQN